jgi:hypothetical protein
VSECHFKRLIIKRMDTFSPKSAKVSVSSTVILCVPSGPLARMSIFAILKFGDVVAIVEGLSDGE